MRGEPNTESLVLLAHTQSSARSYWDGLSPDGPLADAYGPLELWTLESRLPAHSESNTHWYLPPTARLSDYYHDYFSSLKSAGIDFVKVDDQAHQDYVLSREGDGGDAGELRTEMLRSMRTAADKIFGPGTTIHCMAGSPRIWGGELALVNKGSKSIVASAALLWIAPPAHPPFMPSRSATRMTTSPTLLARIATISLSTRSTRSSHAVSTSSRTSTCAKSASQTLRRLTLGAAITSLSAPSRLRLRIPPTRRLLRGSRTLAAGRRCSAGPRREQGSSKPQTR